MMAVAPQRLNNFQLLMRGWARLAPYNFVHAMRLPQPVDIQRWQIGIVEALRAFELDVAKVRIEQADELETHLQQELHRPFSSSMLPVRFFVVSGNGDGHWFGITLDHWFADDFSCRRLLQRIYSWYAPETKAAGSPSIERLRQVPRQWSKWHDWRCFVERSVGLTRARRISFRDPLDFTIGTFQVILPDGALDATRKLARENSATVHDVFLAATAQTFGASSLGRDDSNRDSVAVGSIMNARRFHKESIADNFGLNLSQYITMERKPHECSLDELIRRIAAQTRPIKASPQPDLVAPTRFMWRLNFSRESKATFFIRGAPLVAGLSNVNLTGSWIEQSDITAYRRIGPTGPIVPMVLMITTFRGRIFFDVTYRKTAFGRAEAEHVVNEIVRRVAAVTTDE